MKRIFLFLLFINLAFAVPCSNEKLFQAAKDGKIKLIEDFKKSKCSFHIKDSKGFTPFDLAYIHGNAALAEKLMDLKTFKRGEFSSALIRYVQMGLRYLNFDAGPVDGKLNSATTKAIKNYQKHIKHNPSGQIKPQWLVAFRKDLIKKAQTDLQKMGYKVSPDGVLGAGTKKAISEFAKKNKLSNPNYDGFYYDLINKLMIADNERNKKVLAKKEKETKQTKGKNKKEVASNKRDKSKPEDKKRSEREKQEKKVAAERNKQQMLEEARKRKVMDDRKRAEAQRLKAQAEAQAKARQAQRELELQRQKLQEQRELDEIQRRNAAAIAEAQRIRLEAKQREEAERMKAEQEIIKQQQQRAAAISAQLNKPQITAPTAPTAAPTVKLPQSNITETSSGGRVRKKNNYRTISGILLFNGENNCSISGQKLDSGWCRSYYTTGNGKKCDAVVSKTGGTVRSLRCK